jgi:hypothetical protein
MDFDIIGDITGTETIATGSGTTGRVTLVRGNWYRKARNENQGIHLERHMAKAAKRLFICLDNSGYEVSLERRKIYVALPDTKAERAGYLRIIDESGEDYLYPAQRFVAAELPVSTRRAVLHAA